MKIVLAIALVSVAIYFAIAGGLILSQHPSPAPSGAEGGLDFSAALAADLADMPEPESYAARDGAMLSYRRYPGSGAAGRKLYLVHGSGWHGMQFHRLAARLSQAGVAEIFVPDLRGHGAEPERRGDIDYIAQLEDDLADLVAATAGDRKDARIVLAGHSSGGGLVVRFAGGAHGGLADGYVLLAPFLKYNAPTTRPDSGGWARPLTRRIIGLTMLNAVGLRFLNHLTAIQFNMPDAVLSGPLGHTATTAYSYRLNTGFAPRSDYAADLRAMTQPFLVVAGADDEAFVAERYEPVISRETGSGTYETVEGVGHLGIVYAPETATLIAEWLESRL